MGGGGGGQGGFGWNEDHEDERKKKKVLWQGWADRVAADPQFVYKVVIEQVCFDLCEVWLWLYVLMMRGVSMYHYLHLRISPPTADHWCGRCRHWRHVFATQLGFE